MASKTVIRLETPINDNVTLDLTYILRFKFILGLSFIPLGVQRTKRERLFLGMVMYENECLKQ